MAIGSIGFETRFNIGHKYISQFRIFHPLPVRRQLVIKGLIGYFNILGMHMLHANCDRQKRQDDQY